MKYFFLFLTFGCCLTIFSQQENTVDERMRAVKALNEKGLIVAFYHSDSLNNKYRYLVEQDSILKREQRQFETDREHKQQVIQEKYNALVREQKAMLISGAEMQKLQSEFEYLTKGLEEFQQTEGTRLQNKAFEMQALLQKKVATYSETFCKLYGLDMLLMHASGGQFNYINPTLDVTQIFIDFVNSEEEKNAK